jgi:hypothetical protein
MLNREETLATISTTFVDAFASAGFHLFKFKRVMSWEQQKAHLLLREVRADRERNIVNGTTMPSLLTSFARTSRRARAFVS